MSRLEQDTGGELVGAKALLFTVVTKGVIQNHTITIYTLILQMGKGSTDDLLGAADAKEVTKYDLI